MSGALRGRLVSTTFATEILPTLGITPPSTAWRRALERWCNRRNEQGGPAFGARAVADVLLVPLLRLLGYEVLRRLEGAETIRLDALAGDSTRIPILVAAWDADLGRCWRSAIIAGIEADVRWCICANGRALRVCDAHRTWSRDYLEFDFDLLAQPGQEDDALWTLLSAGSLAGPSSHFDNVVDRSARHGIDVCRTLGDSVVTAVAQLLQSMPRTTPRSRVPSFEQALTIVYRILFLLFAEARGLVPIWHQVYRDRYTIASIVTSLIAGGRTRGTWAALQAIARLAHAGCTAGELTVTAFNGRLFAPSHVPTVEQKPIDDAVVADVILAVSTIQRTHRRARIEYRDLDVEQLGAVYEHLLEFQPVDTGGALSRSRDLRKASATFYTPRQVTAFLARRTLEPLVSGRTADQILAMRIVDPAMGSGAFLVACCRYLARAVEDALVREGTWGPGDVTPGDRAQLRRQVAQRCLYGVDVNPVAVQLARLSLWLATLAADRPLTFLDHHLVTGNSLVGATFADLARQPGAVRGPVARARPLPLFDDADLNPVLNDAATARLDLGLREDVSAAIVREKEHLLAGIHSRDSTLGRWTRVLDLWCSGWFLPRAQRLDRGTFAELSDSLLRGRGHLPAATVRTLLDQIERVAGAVGFLHWPMAFPEAFANGADGFDAVVGNPPWDMVRGDSGDQAARRERREDAQYLTGFVRESGVYRIASNAHINRYALFLERSLQLVRPGGRIGLVLPAGVIADVGAAPLRRHLFDRAAVDSLSGLDNRLGIFPIHRSVRFVLLSATTGTATDTISCRFGITDPVMLDAFRPTGVRLSRQLLARMSGEEDLGVPELLTEHDVRIVEQITASVPPLGAREGWNLRFGRELNASDDRASFVPRTGAADARPVLEGKQLGPFRVAVEAARHELAPGADVNVARRARLAYRDVASATNRLTLIAAIVPARCVTTHTLFCLKAPLPLDTQHVICALMNSFVANYLIRMRVNTHVTAALVARLRLPVVAPGSPDFVRLNELSRRLASADTSIEQMDEYIELQAHAARLYGLTPTAFAHVLETFPLIPRAVRDACLVSFNNFSFNNFH